MLGVAVGVTELKMLNTRNVLSSIIAETYEMSRTLAAEFSRIGKEALKAQATIAGLTAQLDAFKKAYPDSHLLKKTNRYNNNGSNKTADQLLFEKTFDQFLRDNGIENPTDYREE